MTNTTTDAEKVAVFDALAKLGPDLFLDNATYFSCFEADTIAVFVRVAHGEQMAADFLSLHAEDDDEVDPHKPDGSSHYPTSVIDKEIK